jgi:hypothetical protein
MNAAFGFHRDTSPHFFYKKGATLFKPYLSSQLYTGRASVSRRIARQYPIHCVPIGAMKLSRVVLYPIIQHALPVVWMYGDGRLLSCTADSIVWTGHICGYAAVRVTSSPPCARGSSGAPNPISAWINMVEYLFSLIQSDITSLQVTNG